MYERMLAESICFPECVMVDLSVSFTRTNGANVMMGVVSILGMSADVIQVGPLG